jgi:hypothetical protein
MQSLTRSLTGRVLVHVVHSFLLLLVAVDDAAAAVATLIAATAAANSTSLSTSSSGGSSPSILLLGVLAVAAVARIFWCVGASSMVMVAVPMELDARSDHAPGEGGGLALRQAVAAHRHEPRRHLVVRHSSSSAGRGGVRCRRCRVPVDQPRELGIGVLPIPGPLQPQQGAGVVPGGTNAAAVGGGCGGRSIGRRFFDHFVSLPSLLLLLWLFLVDVVAVAAGTGAVVAVVATAAATAAAHHRRRLTVTIVE